MQANDTAKRNEILPKNNTLYTWTELRNALQNNLLKSKNYKLVNNDLQPS